MFPVVCFTCGKVIGHLWDRFQREAADHGEDAALDRMNIPRICCRRMFKTHVETIDVELLYAREPPEDSESDEDI